PTAPSVNDACGNVIDPVITASTDPDCEGQKIYTFTYTDCAGNEAVYTYTYTIEVPNAPIVPANDSSTVECLANATQPTAPEVTDACGNDIVPVITQSADPDCEGEKIYTFTYTDCADNVSVYTYTYNIDVNTAPLVPENDESTVQCLADAVQPTAPELSNACGDSIVPVITESTDPVCEGQKIYTFTYTDCAGNEAVYTYTYNIELNAFILPPNAIETVDNLDEAVEPTPPTVTDNCGNEITPSEPTKSETPDCQGSVVYTYTYTDCANNTADWTYTYTIELAPFTVPENESSTVECLADATAPVPPTINDANGTEITPVMTQSTDPECEGDKIYTFTYTDCAGNTGIWEYTYTINTITLPTVPTNDSSTVQCLAEATQPTAPSVNDACGNAIDPVITSSTDPDCEGQKIYTFTYTDCAGNEAVYTYTYNIEVANAPIVPANDSSTVECLANATQPTAPEVTDVCGNDIVPVITQSADPDCEGEKIYTFTYTDCANNVSVYTYTYTIDVTTAPTVPDNAESTVQCLANAIQPEAPEITNACGDSIVPVITESTDPICEGQKIYTFTYTDCAGNEAIYTYTYNIELNAFILPDNVVEPIDNFDDAVEPTPPTVTDNCGNIITPSEPTKSETPDCQGSVIYTFTYTDCANNTADWTFTYGIELAPFTVPENESSIVECISDAIVPTPPTVFDSNGDEITPVMTQSTDLQCEGNKTYTFTYTDCAGNTDIWEYTYEINLTVAPVVPNNSGSTVNCIDDAVLPIAPIVTDSCGNAIIPTVSQNQDPECEGEKIYTFIYTDCAGNESVFIYTYTIEVPNGPIVPDNDSSTVECLANATQPVVAEVFDSCGNEIIPVITESPDPDCEGQKIYTFSYTDCAGNESIFTYTYTIDITTAPVVPQNDGSIIECIEDATQPVIPDVTDPCGNDITPVITQSPDPDCEGDKVYTFTFTDCAGNQSVYVYTYTIQKTAPEAPTNDSTTVECLEEALQPTALVLTDACGNNITPIITENEDPVCEGEKIYTFTYTDCAGNEIVYTYTYIIKDTTPPVITIPESVTAECSDDFSPLTLNEATAIDNCDPNPIITYNDVRTNGTCSGVYTIVRTWTATDACGNSVSRDQVISIADTIAPTFDQDTLPGDIVVECDAIIAPETLTATDNCGTAVVTVQDERIDGNCPNNYVIKRSYIATDDCGVSNIHVQTITVQDTTPPVFVENLPSPNIVVECDAIPEPIILTATDTCGNATVSITDSRTNGGCSNNYTITRRWVATDECGLTTTHTQNIIVQDTTAPTFVDALPENIVVECDMVPEPSTLTAMDNCGEAIVTVSDVRTQGDCPSNYILARTYLATDECGLTTSHTQIITVQDTTAPIPTTEFEPVLNVSCTDIPEAITMEFSDNCSSTVFQEFNETNSFDENVIADYQIVRTWTVSDECGNQEVYTQTLNVALDEIINEVVAQDICFDNGVVNLDGFLAENVIGGSWELIEGSPVATINGSIFDPTNLDTIYSEEFNPNTEGMEYILRHTGFQSGCLNITDVIMIVDAKCRVLPCGAKDISISTAITPNGDKFNETFDIEGITLCGFVAEVKIFNRWGALVFESNEYTLGSEREGNAFGVFGKWNGSSTKASFGNNGKLPNGTYYYIINLRNSGLDPITGPVYLGTK
ncbi:MAG: gliding motility-associated C-terminal domain-containing protein, partial [Algibacter sp.]|uniref:gliding motility-associated C-terminal domain-containing protein n=1 Tax=Algibacter sp. TaxID=1872428 RepID=UPI003296AC33